MQMKYFELVKPGTNHDFVKYRRIAVSASLVVNALILLGAIVWPKLNYGVDFAGGTELQLKFNKPVDAADVRDEVGKAGFGEPTVQVYGNPDERQFLVRVERIALLTPEGAAKVKDEVSKDLAAAEPTAFHFDPEVGDKLDFTFKKPIDPKQLQTAVEKAGVEPKEVRSLASRRQPQEYTVIAQGPGDKIGAELRKRFGQDSVDVVRTEYVGPQVGKQLRNDGILAVLYAMGMILSTSVPLRLPLLAGRHHRPHPRRHRHPRVLRRQPPRVQSDLGDRDPDRGGLLGERHHRHLRPHPREQQALQRPEDAARSHQLSINEMLGRTILTSGATALSLVGLIIYGVGTIQDFALAMLVGIISGTYSTWYIASPMTIWLEEHMTQRRMIEAEKKPKTKPPSQKPQHSAAAR